MRFRTCIITQDQKAFEREIEFMKRSQPQTSTKPHIDNGKSKKHYFPKDSSIKQKYRDTIELIELIGNDDTLSGVENMHVVTYAPNMGYRTWIFKYKKVYVALFDDGNGHYSYFTMVSRLQVIWAKICVAFQTRIR